MLCGPQRPRFYLLDPHVKRSTACRRQLSPERGQSAQKDEVSAAGSAAQHTFMKEAPLKPALWFK